MNLLHKRETLVDHEDVDGEALATLVVNKLRGALKIVAVKAPGFGDRRKAMLEDIAILTGRTVISKNEDLPLKIQPSRCWELQKKLIDKDNTTLLSRIWSSRSEYRVGQIKAQIENATSDYDKEKLQERLAKLSGGVVYCM